MWNLEPLQFGLALTHVGAYDNNAVTPIEEVDSSRRWT